MKTIKAIFLLFGISVLLFSCRQSSKSMAEETSADSLKISLENDSKIKLGLVEVRIINQIWSKLNLNVSVFRNGDAIPEARTEEEWDAAGKQGKAAWCYYSNDPSNGSKFGKLYNWFAVNDPRGLAPVGWHIPSDAEWKLLIKNMGGERFAKEKLKSTTGWNINCNGTNISGFTALPSGYRTDAGPFHYVGGNSSYWSTTVSGPRSAWDRYLSCAISDVTRYGTEMEDGLSVRCVKD